MIKNREPLSMTESMEYIADAEKEESPDMKKFIKKFVKLAPEKAKSLRKKIQELNLLKVKGENISEIIDILPDNQENLNKIFTDVSLDEDESKKILDAVKEFK